MRIFVFIFLNMFIIVAWISCYSQHMDVLLKHIFVKYRILASRWLFFNSLNILLHYFLVFTYPKTAICFFIFYFFWRPYVFFLWLPKNFILSLMDLVVVVFGLCFVKKIWSSTLSSSPSPPPQSSTLRHFGHRNLNSYKGSTLR